MTETNPLLQITTPIPFDRIRPEHIGPAVAQLIEESRQRIEAIAAPQQRTYSNTLAAFDASTEPLGFATGIVSHLESVATTPELREAYNAVQPAVSAFRSSIPLHAGLWKAIKEFEATPEARDLSPIQKRYLSKTVDYFQRHGAGLNPAAKKRLEEIDIELATITLKFGQNVVDSTKKFEYRIEDEAALAGLPPSAIAAARQDAESKGQTGWRFTLQAPSYIAVMTYLDDRGIREAIYRAYNSRATEAEHNNAELIAKILGLRKEKALLLGYTNFADLVLADRMAKSGLAAQKFLRELEGKTEAAFRSENEALAEFAQISLEPWDVGYFAEKKRKAEYDFDEEDLRPYFSLENVLEGLWNLVHRLFGIRVQEAPGVPVWHPETKFYEIRDEDETLIGSFYSDWFPRETKRPGAWMDAFLTGTPETDGHWRTPVGLMCGNLTPPLAAEPSLLTHREVETIFHEFGHLLHHALSKVEIRSLAGTSVAWDFVELPSQIMENWCWERESLDLFARHWKTGELIPDTLFEKMQRARTYRGGNTQMRQLGFGTVDLALHIDYDPSRDGEPLEYGRKMLQPFAVAPLPRPYGMLAGFTHLFSDPVGYGAAYYSYKWAEVLDADAFARFKDGGLFNREVGIAFRNAILSRGDSEDPAILFREFMGRDPDPNALLRRLGLAA